MRAASAHESLEALAHRALLARRRSLIERRQATERDARALLVEHETDWEDEASQLSLARDLDRLVDSERAELTRVTAALDRLDDGSWGTCVVCQQPIERARLRALPEATRCHTCSGA
jgi:RNA polymerase-binding transcription factor DksA